MGWDEPDRTPEKEVLEGLMIEDIGGRYRELLLNIGFQEVRVEELPTLPKHAFRWLPKEIDPEILMKAIRNREGPRYWYVRTELGNFAIYHAGVTLLDLTGSGIRAKQIVCDQHDKDADNPLCIMGKDALISLYRAMKER